MAKTKRHQEKLDHRKVEFISFISLLLGFSGALLLYVTSSFFKQAAEQILNLLVFYFPNWHFLDPARDAQNVGIFYFVAHILVLFFLFNLHKYIRKLGKAGTFFLFFLLQILLTILLVATGPSWVGALAMIGYIIAIDLVWVLLDIILETYSEDKSTGRTRGLHLMITNAGFILGPLVSTKLMAGFGFAGLFLTASIINILILALAMIFLRNANSKFEERLTLKDILNKVLTNADVIRIYLVSFGLEFFYALMVVYSPIYLIDQGFSWAQLGVIFTIMLLPFVIFEYPLGILADKKMGEKELLIAGLLIMALSVLIFYFTHSQVVWIWGAILFLTRVGAAFVEVLRDSYFYKRIDGRDADLISFFRTARPVAYVVAAGFSGVLLKLFHLPIEAVFLVVSVVLLLTLLPAVFLVDNVSEAERK